jgi:hypothetical protein
MVFAVNKTQGDTYMVARAISNAYLGYQNWTFPSLGSKDMVS